MASRLLQRLFDHARTGAPAIRLIDSSADDGQAITYAKLAAAVRAVARRLEAIEPGGVVLLSLPNSPDYTAAFFGILLAGASVFPVTPELVAPEIHAAAQRSNAMGVIGGRSPLTHLSHLALRISEAELIDICQGAFEKPDEAPMVPDRSAHSGGMLLQSSGTTGLPKIVRRSIASLDAVSSNMVRAVGFTPQDRILATLPLCHSYGVEHGLLAPHWAGSCVHLCHGFDLPTVLRELSGGQVTLFPGVPFMFEILTKTGDSALRFNSLRRAYSAGGPLPPEVYEAFLHRYSIRVSQLYGATEIGSVLFNDPNHPHFDPASVGHPMDGVSVRIVNVNEPRIDQPLPIGAEGQVAIAATSMLSEYVGDDPPPLLAGHFLTGDLGKLDTHGALTLTGRLKLLIDVGGLKVNPLEVEQVLSQHPLVADCVVVPMSLTTTVTRLKAIVTLRDQSVELLPEDLRRFARQRLSAYKVPRVIEVRPSLPKTPTGKILRHQLSTS